MKKNKALAVPFVLWAVLFIAVPLAMVVWYGVTVEETPAYVEVAGDNGQTLFQLEDGTVTAERPQKRTAVSLANFRRMLEPTYLKLLLRSLKIALFTTIICLLLGYPVALILSSRDFKRPGLWLMLNILPMWMNCLLRSYSWMSILENSGILNSWIASLRGAIPAGIAAGLPPAAAAAAAILGNLVPIPFLILLLRRIFGWLRKSSWVGPKIDWLERRAHLKGRMVRKYRLPGLIILVAIPLPGTGAWTGALVAALLDIRMRHALPAIFLGVVIAGAIVTTLTYGVVQLF